jgi:hypothetical protein
MVTDRRLALLRERVDRLLEVTRLHPQDTPPPPVVAFDPDHLEALLLDAMSTDSNPFESSTVNATRACRLAKDTPVEARRLFDRARRNGTIDRSLERVEASLFPAPKEDEYSWVDVLGSN